MKFNFYMVNDQLNHSNRPSSQQQQQDDESSEEDMFSENFVPTKTQVKRGTDGHNENLQVIINNISYCLMTSI